MDKDDDHRMMTQLQPWDVDERRARRERERVLVSEALHRQRLLDGDRPRLEDLAAEWIELLRASRAKRSD